MPLAEPTTLAVAASLFVAVLAAVMAYLGFRSYQKTQNGRLLFVVFAFVTFVLKSLFVGYNLWLHQDPRAPAVPHDMLEFTTSIFDLLIVLMLFIPFFMRR